MQLEPSTSECKIQEAINKISVNNNNDLEITQEEWRNKFNHWKESTFTSPSGVHLGHYKSLLSMSQTMRNWSWIWSCLRNKMILLTYIFDSLI
jgi:hypothetical protein